MGCKDEAYSANVSRVSNQQQNDRSKDPIKHAETANAVAADQHGSRKHHKSINTCLNKKLVCDVLRQKKRAGAVAILDGKGCYNAISHPIAVLTLASFGVPQKVCKVLF